MVPSDWQAQSLHQPNNPLTVEDMKVALDLTVVKKGMMNLVFHPHGWIRNDQMVELIDYAVEKYGKKVKFLTFAEVTERLNQNLLSGTPLRDEQGRENPNRDFCRSEILKSVFKKHKILSTIFTIFCRFIEKCVIVLAPDRAF